MLLPEYVRDKEVDELLSKYHVDATNLTREQKYHLLLGEMGRRYKLTQHRTIVATCIFLGCSGTTVFAMIWPGNAGTP